MLELRSTNIAAAGYDPAIKELHVQFRTGARYVLYDVEPAVFKAFIDAESPGKFYNKHLRSAAYKFARISEPEAE